MINVNSRQKEIIIDMICILFIILFLYAAVSKLVDHNKFSLELRKSPMLVHFAGLVAWSIPFIEIIVSIGLLFSATRTVSLIASFFLMCVFTFYIVAILGFSEYVPCTCGGVLQKMSWTQHLFFNITFAILAGYAVLTVERTSSRKPFVLLAVSFVCSVLLIGSVYALTYDDKNKYSSFNIRLASQKIPPLDSVNLQFNSFYFAGQDHQALYLANHNSPLNLIKMDNDLHNVQDIRLNVEGEIDFLKPYVRIFPPYFFLLDGVTPKVLRGDLGSKTARNFAIHPAYFNAALPIDSNLLAVRIFDRQYQLGKLGGDTGLEIKQGILQKQIDGRFCLDGMIQRNRQMNRILYTYYYRNEFIVLDSTISVMFVGNTIDSISTAKLKISSQVNSDEETSVVVPVVTVNKLSCTDSSFIYINSNIRARNESEENFKNADRIDVYSIENGVYGSSFYLPNGKEKNRDFRVKGNWLYVLRGNFLLRYNIESTIAADPQWNQKYSKAFYRPVK